MFGFVARLITEQTSSYDVFGYIAPPRASRQKVFRSALK